MNTPRPPPWALLELASNGAIFLPSSEKMTVSGGSHRRAKMTNLSGSRFHPWFIVNQQRDQVLSKGQESELGRYAQVSKRD